MQDCPECEEEECVSYRNYPTYQRFTCQECGHEWEEDYQGPAIYSYNEAFTRDQKEHLKARRDYEKHYGPIKRGWELHHVDHDSSNNSLDNLIAVPATVHTLIHDNPAKYGSKAAIRALLPK